jgi:DNA-binding response OmpR family regulator
LELDPNKHLVSRGGKVLSLTPKEFSILEYLMHHADEVVTRTMVIEHVWDMNYDTMSNVVDAFISTLRKKVDKNSPHKLIHTLHGVGFKISAKT